VPVALGGMLLMLVGWVPYVMMMSGWFGAPADAGLAADMGPTGSIILGAAATNVMLAGAAAGLAGLLVSQWRYGKPDVLLSSVALLGGLVAICAGAGTLSAAAAVFIGAVAGIVVPLAAVQIDLRCRIDDPAGAIAVHVVGGAWGIIAAGLLAPAATSRLRLIGVQVLGLACIAGMALLAASVLFGAAKLTVGLRAAEADEYDGLDLAEHDLNAYPDFQQNMIKSYHLREA
jgi:Amt family ammonium transporter